MFTWREIFAPLVYFLGGKWSLKDSLSQGLDSLIDMWHVHTLWLRIDSYDVIFFAAFILLVTLRYFRQNVMQNVEDGEAQVAEKEQQQALVMVAEPEEEQRQALVVAEQHRQC